MALVASPRFISLQPHLILRTSPSLSVNSFVTRTTQHPKLNNPPLAITCSSSPHKLARDPRLDKHVVKQNNIQFVQNLKTLLLSKPKHFIPIPILYKYRSFLSLPKPRSVLSMIRRYPTIFELFTIPTPPHQLCVRLTPAAAALAKRESDLKKRTANSLAAKLQKLLMLASPYHRLLLSKLVHVGPDLGLPVNFPSRLCNDHPDKFKVVDTSYGRALELVTWDPDLANVLPFHDEDKSSLGLIVNRPLKFKHLRLRKGLNVKRRHHEYLVKFRDVPNVCPYRTNAFELVKESIMAEKRGCAVVREILGMTVEKRTLVDHLMRFRKEFGLPKKVRGMLVRHPEMFYVSLKGQRDSVFLVEGYSDEGVLVEKDEMLVIRDDLMKLVRGGEWMRRERRKEYLCDAQTLDNRVDNEYYDDYEDGFDDLFQLEGYSSDDDLDDDDDESRELTAYLDKGDYLTAEATPWLKNKNYYDSEPW